MDLTTIDHLAVLVDDPGIERHALDLVDRVEGVAQRPAVDGAIRTGIYCVYEPTPDDEARWIVQHGVNGSAHG